MFWGFGGEIEFDSTQKRGAYANSGEFFHASARTPGAEPLRPLKRNASVLLNTPLSTPEPDFHLARLRSNPIGSAAYIPLIFH